MQESIEVELLQERIDSMTVANEELRERLVKAGNELIAITERCQQLELRNRELGAQIDRLRLHLTQGVEL